MRKIICSGDDVLEETGETKGMKEDEGFSDDEFTEDGGFLEEDWLAPALSLLVAFLFLILIVIIVFWH